jgi:hypothetical protein
MEIIIYASKSYHGDEIKNKNIKCLIPGSAKVTNWTGGVAQAVELLLCKC